MSDIKDKLSKEVLDEIFPKQKTDDFFDALFGDVEAGAYDIELAYRDNNSETLNMALLLHQRPGHCLACNLTQGLPQVFSRHPIINITGIVQKIDQILGDTIRCGEWTLGYTEHSSSTTHAIPLDIQLKSN